MADGVSITAGVGTTIATDQIGSDHYQLIKLAFGALNTGTLVTSSSGLPVDVVGIVPGTTATALGKAEDAAHGSGDTGVMALAVRANTAAATAADGDYTPLLTDSTGQLYVNVGTAALPTGAATSAKQDTANTSLSSIDGKTPSLGQATAANSVPVVLTSAQLSTLTPPAAISGFATSAKQDTGNTSLSSIDGKTPSLGQALASASVPVVLTASQLSTLTPNTGFATETTLAALLTESDFDSKVGSLTASSPGTDTASASLNGRLQRIAQRLTSLIGLLPSALTGSGNLKVSLEESTATQAVSGTVTANIGTVATLATAANQTTANTSLSTLAGAVTSSKIQADVLTLPNVTLAAGTNTNEVVGDVAHDAAIAGNPITIGGVASAAAPTSVSADQDAVRAWFLRNGAQATVLTAAGALIGGDATNGLDVDVTRVTGTVTVDGSGVTQPVSGTVTANIGTVGTLATAANQTTANTALSAIQTSAQLIDDTVLAEDAAHSSGDKGVMALAVRQDTAAALAGTDGDYIPLIVDSTGKLHVNVGNTVTVGSHAVTNAGTFATQATLQAGTALVGKVSSGLDTSTINNGTTALTPKFASISTSSSGNTTVVAAVSSKKIRVLNYRFQGDADVSVKFRDNTAGVDLTGAMATGAKGGGGGASFSPVGHFETASGNALSINLSGAVQTSGHLCYVEV